MELFWKFVIQDFCAFWGCEQIVSFSIRFYWYWQPGRCNFKSKVTIIHLKKKLQSEGFSAGQRISSCASLPLKHTQQKKKKKKRLPACKQRPLLNGFSWMLQESRFYQTWKSIFASLPTGFGKNLVRHAVRAGFPGSGWTHFISPLEPTGSFKLLTSGSTGSKKIWFVGFEVSESGSSIQIFSDGLVPDGYVK